MFEPFASVEAGLGAIVVLVGAGASSTELVSVLVGATVVGWLGWAGWVFFVVSTFLSSAFWIVDEVVVFTVVGATGVTGAAGCWFSTCGVTAGSTYSSAASSW